MLLLSCHPGREFLTEFYLSDIYLNYLNDTLDLSRATRSSGFSCLLQLLVLAQADRVLDEVDWLLARKKSQTTSDRRSSGSETPVRLSNLHMFVVKLLYYIYFCDAGDATQADDKQDALEKAVTLQLGTLLTALSELVQTPLMLGTASVTLLRGLTRTYSTLSTLAKHVGSCLLSLLLLRSAPSFPSA